MASKLAASIWSRRTCSEWSSSLEMIQGVDTSSCRVCRRSFISTSHCGVSGDRRFAGGQDSSSESRTSMTSDSSGSESESSMTSPAGKWRRIFFDGLVDGLICGRAWDMGGMGSGAGRLAADDIRLRTSSALGFVGPGAWRFVGGVDGCGGGEPDLNTTPPRGAADGKPTDSGGITADEGGGRNRINASMALMRV